VEDVIVDSKMQKVVVKGKKVAAYPAKMTEHVQKRPVTRWSSCHRYHLHWRRRKKRKGKRSLSHSSQRRRVK
jgi:hypothetical protein